MPAEKDMAGEATGNIAYLYRVVSNKRGAGRHGPLELNLSPRFVEGEACHANARPYRSYRTEDP